MTISRRDLLRAAMAGVIVLPSERFVRRFFPVGIDLPRVWRPQSGEELASMAQRAREGDTILIERVLTLTSPIEIGSVTVTGRADKLPTVRDPRWRGFEYLSVGYSQSGMLVRESPSRGRWIAFGPASTIGPA